MSFGSKPIAPPALRPRPSSRTEDAFAVGSRVVLTPGTMGAGDLELLDEDGMQIGLRLKTGTEVVITAWKPRRAAPARYRVCAADRTEGWIDAANLKRIPPPPPPVLMAQPAPPPPAKPAPRPARPAAPSKTAAARTRPQPAAKPSKPPSPAATRPQRPAKPAPPAASRARPVPKAAKPATKRAAKPAKRSRKAPKRGR